MITTQEIKSLFDYHDGTLYWKQDRGGNRCKGKAAGTKNGRYLQIQLYAKAYKVHRLIFALFNGFWPNEIDHINGDAFDNRIENLRAATRSQNCQNTKTQHNNTSGVRGVCWHKRLKKWQVRIGNSAKRIHLGYFDNFELAELVAIEARVKYHGNFARLA